MADDTMAQAGEAMKAGGERMVQGGQSIGLKVLEQAEENAREAFAAMRSAAQARDISEVMKIQSEYLQGQGSRSVQQAREIGEMIAQFGRESTNAFRQG